MARPIFVIVFSTIILLKNVTKNDAQSTGTICESRDFGFGSVACACNSTYCDFIPEIKAPAPDTFYVYESNKAGKRFDCIIGNVSTVKSHDSVELFLNRSQRYQQMIGWGGAFTDSTGINIRKLSKATQKMLLQTYFAGNGSRYNLGRVPIGGTDFSLRPYSYDDLTNDEIDKDLKQFALQDEDLHLKIPFMITASVINPELLFFGAPWSGPAWMKTNNALDGVGALRYEYYQTYANYFVKFLDEYGKHNISFWAVSTGNEPNDVFAVKINSMVWTPRTEGKWVSENLGPTLAASIYNKTQIHLFDDQRYFLPWFVEDMVSEYPNARNYASGIAIHWYFDRYVSPVKLDQTSKLFPELYLLMTEACIGSLGADHPKVQLGSWKRAEDYIVKIFENVNHGVVGWVDWNLALDEEGGPNWILNNVDAPIIVHPEMDEFYKQPLYYAMTHFSRFVPRNSTRVNIVDSDKVKTTAFETPEKSVVILLCNTDSKTQSVSITDRKNHYVNLELSPSSFSTVVYMPPKQ